MRKLALVLIVLALVAANGCTSRVIKEATEFGGRGSYAFVSPMSAGTPLAGYTRFELEKFQDDSGGAMPAEVLPLLPGFFQEELAKKGIPNRSGKEAVVRGTVFYYESAGLMGQVFGPFEEVLARVELVDKSSGKVLCVANAVGRTKTTRNQSPAEKSRGLARGIVKLIDDHFPSYEKDPVD